LRSDAESPLNSGTFCSSSASSETSTQRLPWLPARAQLARTDAAIHVGSHRIRHGREWRKGTT
jgi:hypothetical protein